MMHQDIYRRIVSAKYILERAGGIQAERNEMSQSICVLLMHDAVELLMIAVLDHLNVVVPNDRKFMAFWDLLKQATKEDAPDKSAMQTLNAIRVGLKHKGVLPNSNEVRVSLARSRGFFENILKLYCDLSYSEVSLIDLVPHQDVRATLNEAQQKFLSGDKKQAMVGLQTALHILEGTQSKALLQLHAPRVPEIPSEMRASGWGKYFNSLHSFLRSIANTSNALMLGVDPARFADFVNAGPSLLWNMNGTLTQVQYWRPYDDMPQERFDELLSFVIDYSLKLSEAYIPKSIRYPSNFVAHYERMD